MQPLWNFSVDSTALMSKENDSVWGIKPRNQAQTATYSVVGSVLTLPQTQPLRFQNTTLDWLFRFFVLYQVQVLVLIPVLHCTGGQLLYCTRTCTVLVDLQQVLYFELVLHVQESCTTWADNTKIKKIK
jgi:hypothetical protein